MEKAIEDLRIRPLRPDDRDRVYAFYRQLGKEGTAFFNANRGNEKATYAYMNGELPYHIYWAAVADTPNGEEIAGIVFLWDKNKKIPWLGIAIAENWKGRHLGRRLMATAEEWAKSAGAGGILLTTAVKNVRAQGLYTRMGYERIGNYFNGEFIYLLSFPNEQASGCPNE